MVDSTGRVIKAAVKEDKKQNVKMIQGVEDKRRAQAE